VHLREEPSRGLVFAVLILSAALLPRDPSPGHDEQHAAGGPLLIGNIAQVVGQPFPEFFEFAEHGLERSIDGLGVGWQAGQRRGPLAERGALNNGPAASSDTKPAMLGAIRHEVRSTPEPSCRASASPTIQARLLAASKSTLRVCELSSDASLATVGPAADG